MINFLTMVKSEILPHKLAYLSMVKKHLYKIKFVFSRKATKIDEIFAVDLTLCSKCQIDSEDFVDFCGLLRKHEL